MTNPIKSANTLFHFTDKLDNIVNILTMGFKINLCEEDFSFLRNTDSILDLKDSKLKIPMVCFNDVPLSRISKHIEIYGGYGIGLEKEWGIDKQLSPICYVTPNNLLNLILGGILYNYFDVGMENQSEYKKLGNLLIHFIKPYKGDFTKRGKTHKDYSFYEEREWRYIPLFSDLYKDKLPDCMTADDIFAKLKTIHRILNDDNREINHNSIEYLGIKAKNIKYIVVESENEVNELIEKINNIKEGILSQQEINLLLTKIIPSNYILEDF